MLAADDEHHKLSGIVELRRARWRELLSPAVAPLVSVAVASAQAHGLDDGDVLTLLRGASRGTRGCTGDALACKVDAVDLGGAFADRLEGVVRAMDPEATAAVTAVGGRLREARNAFACSNLRLVVRIASRHPDDRMSLADRVQEGNLGLLIAISRFDPDRGFRFSTYATWWIRFAITRALVNRGRSVRIPAHLHAIFCKARQAEKNLRAELARDPTDEELAAVAGIPLEKLVDARAAMESRTIGLDDPDQDDGGALAMVATGSSFDADDAIDDRRNLDVAQGAFENLDPMERDILVHRFGLEGTEASTLSLLGQRHALSRERIRQLQNQALAKLRHEVESSTVGATAYA